MEEDVVVVEINMMRIERNIGCVREIKESDNYNEAQNKILVFRTVELIACVCFSFSLID
jgi:hypothetical protein